MLKKKIQTKNIALFTYAPFKVEWIFESKETFCIHWFQAFLFSFFFFFIWSGVKVYIWTLASSEAWNSCRPAETLVIACISPQRSWFLHTESQNHKIANWRTCWLAACRRGPLIRTTDWKNKCDRLRFKKKTEGFPSVLFPLQWDLSRSTLAATCWWPQIFWTSGIIEHDSCEVL